MVCIVKGGSYDIFLKTLEISIIYRDFYNWNDLITKLR